MKKRIVTAFVAVMLSIGLAGTSMAESGSEEENQSLGGRIFLVEVEVVSSLVPELPVGTVFPNCYIFDHGGIWIDPAFPDPTAPVSGTWLQHRDHLNTPYTAFADADGLVILQRGWIGSFRRHSALKIRAHSTVFVGELKLAKFVSKGEEVSECPL